MSNNYLFAEATEERQRLQALEFLLDPGTQDVLRPLVAHGARRVLEVGAGAGSIARWLSSAVGADGSVTAVDIDIEPLTTVELPPNVTPVRMDIASEQPERDAYDMVHARYVLEHVADRDAALQHMIAALRPGGWLVIETSDPLTAWLGLPAHPAVTTLRAAFDQTFDDAGGDSYFGRDLPRRLTDHGLTDVQGNARAQFIPGWTSPEATSYRMSVRNVADRLVRTGLIAEDMITEALTVLETSESPFLNHLTISAWGRKP
ncbi:methyltransferase domain-containing protein [Streptomyces sp. GZWMJZ-114]|uniref:methyltransferase domain-containing protein n=1 Tax=Streptomyces sp. GZWMJZ-114 TaxID=2494734 RepID=UPI001011EBB3|nr:methyltransferase domain-containing protein [Streptomyces sp. GZWMJZ-114]